jgi:NAD(P)-dependent dehydrogenase (short-subunit alcohol dehydrogenase family)
MPLTAKNCGSSPALVAAGVDIVKLPVAGHSCRQRPRCREGCGRSWRPDNLLVIKLDITRPLDAQAAVAATMARFGRIDVWSITQATSSLVSSGN